MKECAASSHGLFEYWSPLGEVIGDRALTKASEWKTWGAEVVKSAPKWQRFFGAGGSASARVVVESTGISYAIGVEGKSVKGLLALGRGLFCRRAQMLIDESLLFEDAAQWVLSEDSFAHEKILGTHLVKLGIPKEASSFAMLKHYLGEQYCLLVKQYLIDEQRACAEKTISKDKLKWSGLNLDNFKRGRRDWDRCPGRVEYF